MDMGYGYTLEGLNRVTRLSRCEELVAASGPVVAFRVKLTTSAEWLVRARS
jgi:hypothetical protein